MSLRDQPYLPLFVQDFLTDEKLNECSAESHGIYIKLMCLLHKSETYGKILLEQKYKQNDKPLVNFANKFARHLPFTFDEILSGLNELSFNGVIQYNENELWQKRMIRDNEISCLRAKAGSKGGKTTQLAKAKNQSNIQAKDKANTEYEIENENEYNSSSLGKSENLLKSRAWKTDFEIYKSELNKVYHELLIDSVFISEQSKFHPGVDIALSLEKAVANFWGTEAGWKHKIKKRSVDLDWKRTLTNAIDKNKVYISPYGTSKNITTEARRQQEDFANFKPGDEPSATIVHI
jgi:hypothetical protein